MKPGLYTLDNDQLWAGRSGGISLRQGQEIITFSKIVKTVSEAHPAS